MKKELTKTRTALILAGLMASLLLAALDSTIVGTAMKTIVNDLQGMNEYSWPFTIFMLTSTVIIPIAGGLADIFGRKPVFITGILIFLAGSALCGTSANMLQLILFRGVQGIGGGILVSGVFTIVADLFVPQKRGKYMGIVTSMYGLASIIGPLLGGLLTDNLSWRWIFFINIPIGVFALLLIVFIMPNFKTEGEKRKVDWAGTVSLIAALVPLLLAFSWAGSDYAWASIQIIGMLIFSAAIFVLFIWFEGRSKNPIIPLSFFKNRSISVTLLVAFLTTAIMYAAIMYIPYFVQGIMGSTATTSGAITIPMMFGLLVTSNTTGFLVSKNGKNKPFVFAAFALMALGMWLLSTLQADTPYYLAVLFMIVLGFGIGINLTIGTINVQNAAPREQIGSATSTVQFFRNIGGTIGSAVFGTIMANAMTDGFSKLDLSNVPANVQDLIKNPQILTNAGAISQMLQQAPKEYNAFFTSLIAQAKDALAISVQDVFVFCAFAALAGVALTVFFKNAPFVKKEKARPQQEASEPSLNG